jgi:glycerol-3-phosphate acyltransferase PlsX
MVMGLDALKQRADCHGFVSAGSTGALLTGGFMKLGRIEGVSRPALCPLMPTVVPGQKVMLVDAGANVDCKPQNLAHFALMGDAYMKALGVASPRIALVNVGTEEGKGNELTHQTFDILKKLPINFVGNMEARDTFTGEYDILVADGFVGNVLLKTAEGSTAFLMSHLKRAIKGGFWSKFGALFMRKAFKKVKKLTSEEAAGGSPFLGIKKPVIKAHGNSTAVAFENALSVAIACARADLSEQIKTAIAESAAVING